MKLKGKQTFFDKSGIFTLLEVNINAFYPILSGLVNNRAFKGQNVKADPKIERFEKMYKTKNSY